MLNFFKELFADNKSKQQNAEEENNSLQIASCALLLELANADDEFSDEEKTRVVELMKTNFNLTDEEVNKLLELSQKQIEKSVSAYEFTEIINKQLNEDEKYQIIKNLWQLAYVDGRLDKYEDYYIRKISSNLHVSDKDRIAAKLEVKEEMKL